jgi:hypothetical protein
MAWSEYFCSSHWIGSSKGLEELFSVLGSQFPLGKRQAMPFRHYLHEISVVKTRLELSFGEPFLD